MRARQRANAVRREELGLREHARQDAHQPLAVDQRQQAPLPLPGDVHRRAVLGELGSILEKPPRPPPERAEAVERIGFERGHREERREPDHRAHAHREALAGGRPHDVVEEAVFLVPEPHVFARDVIGRVGDEQEVLEELVGDVLVAGALARELERDVEHVQAVHAHPARRVRLLERRRRRAAACCGRRRRCCRDRGSRPRRRCARACPSGSPTR